MVEHLHERPEQALVADRARQQQQRHTIGAPVSVLWRRHGVNGHRKVLIGDIDERSIPSPQKTLANFEYVCKINLSPA